MAIRINGDNTAANPGITGTDTDTGLQFGTDEVNVVTGGNTRSTVDSSGRLLVGTTSVPPSTTQSHYGKLIVSGSSAGNTHAYAAFITGSTAETQGPEVSRLVFGNTNAEYGRIDVALDGTAGTSSAPGRMVFYTTASGATSPTERLRITSDGTLQLRNSPGIDFSQIQTNKAGMTSETLDSYEEGTWTPQIGIAGSTSGLTYSYQLGVYSKIGNIVQVGAYVVLSSKGSNTGHVSVRNFPFASRNVSNLYVYPYVSLSNCTSTLTAAGSLEFGPGASAATITRNTTGGWSYLDNTVINNNFVVAFTFTYQT